MRLCWPLHRLAVVAAAHASLVAAGCSFPLETMFTKADADVEQTGSTIPADEGAVPAAVAAVPADTDLAYARAAAVEALARGGKDNSIPWENPHTGAGGNITPLAAAYGEGAFLCRDFLASYVHGQAQDWLQGEACRTEQGKWVVKSLRPLRG